MSGRTGLRDGRRCEIYGHFGEYGYDARCDTLQKWRQLARLLDALGHFLVQITQ